MSDNNKGAFGFDDPNRGPLDRAQNALEGRDDPSRGPIDRMENALGGQDDPNRGPLDRAANAVTGGTGGVSAAMGGEASMGHSGGGVISAVFDSNDEAQRAVSELRSAGVNDSSLSLIAQSKGTMTTREGGGEITDEEHTNMLRGILGGGALGAGLGVAALAIPGVGPLAALGAIAASVVPEAMAIGAVAGAAAGSFNEALKKHGVSDEDASYYGDQLKRGGVLVTVHASGVDADEAREILYRNGGHSSSRARAAAI
ncbi:hypothetical protein [Sphingomonas sp.]|uniref:hypothetical protein n=1 Tax=Sphingomonas sp. TaxID=28214 RepID=UPI003BACA796